MSDDGHVWVGYIRVHGNRGDNPIFQSREAAERYLEESADLINQTLDVDEFERIGSGEWICRINSHCVAKLQKKPVVGELDYSGAEQ